MQVNSVNQSQSFYGLNYKNVLDSELPYVKKELPLLSELGKEYDINMTSCFSGIPKFSTIDVVVTPLKKSQSRFKRLFMPKTRESVLTQKLDEGATLESVVQKAIDELNKKTKLSRIIDLFG